MISDSSKRTHELLSGFVDQLNQKLILKRNKKNIRWTGPDQVRGVVTPYTMGAYSLRTRLNQETLRKIRNSKGPSDLYQVLEVLFLLGRYQGHRLSVQTEEMKKLENHFAKMHVAMERIEVIEGSQFVAAGPWDDGLSTEILTEAELKEIRIQENIFERRLKWAQKIVQKMSKVRPRTATEEMSTAETSSGVIIRSWPLSGAPAHRDEVTQLGVETLKSAFDIQPQPGVKGSEDKLLTEFVSELLNRAEDFEVDSFTGAQEFQSVYLPLFTLYLDSLEPLKNTRHWPVRRTLRHLGTILQVTRKLHAGTAELGAYEDLYQDAAFGFTFWIKDDLPYAF